MVSLGEKNPCHVTNTHIVHMHSLDPTSRVPCELIGLTQRELSYLSSSLGFQIAIGFFLKGPDTARLQLIYCLIEGSAAYAHTYNRHKNVYTKSHLCTHFKIFSLWYRFTFMCIH